MGRTIRWVLGFVLLGAVGLGLLLAKAEAGTVVYLKRLAPKVLSAPERASLVDAAKSVFVNLTLSTVGIYRCCRDAENPDVQHKDDVLCTATYQEVLTTAQVIAADLAGRELGELTASNGDWLAPAITTPAMLLVGSQRTKHAGFVTSALGCDLELLGCFECTRSGGEVTCAGDHYATASPSAYMVDRQARQVVRAVGTVE